jgi:hypothetical protein
LKAALRPAGEVTIRFVVPSGPAAGDRVLIARAGSGPPIRWCLGASFPALGPRRRGVDGSESDPPRARPRPTPHVRARRHMDGCRCTGRRDDPREIRSYVTVLCGGMMVGRALLLPRTDGAARCWGPAGPLHFPTTTAGQVVVHLRRWYLVPLYRGFRILPLVRV